MFSSPSRGSYISTLSACDDSSDFFSFSSPSRGSYILYETKVNYDGLAVFSSPSRGSYISTSVLMICRWHFLSSRPLPGVLISLRYIRLFRRILGVVLVPFPGFLYLYETEKAVYAMLNLVLVPFPGFLYLYWQQLRFAMFRRKSSRPLPGVLISLQCSEN